MLQTSWRLFGSAPAVSKACTMPSRPSSAASVSKGWPALLWRVKNPESVQCWPPLSNWDVQVWANYSWLKAERRGLSRMGCGSVKAWSCGCTGKGYWMRGCKRDAQITVLGTKHLRWLQCGLHCGLFQKFSPNANQEKEEGQQKGKFDQLIAEHRQEAFYHNTSPYLKFDITHHILNACSML